MTPMTFHDQRTVAARAAAARGPFCRYDSAMADRSPLLLLLVLPAAAAFGQPPAGPPGRGPTARSGLVLTTTVEELVEISQADGPAEQRLTAFAATDGAAVVYTVAFENVSGRTLENVRITNAIPPQMSYVVGSASGPGGRSLFSVDGGRSFAMPAELGVTPDQYTHIRWLVAEPLDAGARGFVRFRAVWQERSAAPPAEAASEP